MLRKFGMLGIVGAVDVQRAISKAAVTSPGARLH